jgi:hypothetical protein
MKNCVFFLAVLFNLKGFSQKTSSAQAADITKIWLIKNGTFPNDQISFRTYDAAKDSLVFYSSYEFLRSGSIDYTYHVPPGVGVCGNGMPYIKTAEWKLLKENTLSIHINGGYFVAGTYEYYILYTIQRVTDTELVLQKKKVYINKRCQTCSE